MKFYEKTNDITTKIAKGFVGIFAIKLLVFLVVFTFQACTVGDNSEAEISRDAFSDALEISTLNLLQDIQLSNLKGLSIKKDANSEFVYLVKQDGQKLSNTDFINTIHDLKSLLIARNEYGLTVKTGAKANDDLKNYISPGDDIPIDNPDPLGGEDPLAIYTIDEPTAIASLEPSVIEARNYLQTKGFTSQEIDQMIIDENGTEQDLVALVMSMTEIENNQEQGPGLPVNITSISSIFFNTANAQSLTAGEIGTCAAVAIGADILWALGTSSASSWSKAAIKRAFGTVAKKFLGPIGVAIAVVSFGLCILNESQD